MSKRNTVKVKTTKRVAYQLADRDHPDYPCDVMAQLEDKATMWALVVPCNDKGSPWRRVEIIPIYQEDLEKNVWLERHVQNITLSTGFCGNGCLNLAYVINRIPKPESCVNSDYWEHIIAITFPRFDTEKRDALQPWLEVLPDPSEYLADCYDLDPEPYEF